MVVFAVIGAGAIVLSYAASPRQCPSASGKSEGQQVASEANRQWCIWNGGKNANGRTVSHAQLLSWYTDGHPEFWCADFVSYVYKAAGFPFKGSNTYYTRNGWDWPNAYSLEHVPGFTYHRVGTVRPQVGDIAEFNYSGGHVEIVVDTSPLTFVYGDNGNGGMSKNTYDNGSVLGWVRPD
jgi:hypothetical protein